MTALDVTVEDNITFIINVLNSDFAGKVNITVNKNGIPGDTEKPTVTSGIRLGTAAMTTRGFNEEDFRNVARLIDLALRNKDDEEVLNAVKMDVIALMKKHPYLA